MCRLNATFAISLMLALAVACGSELDETSGADTALPCSYSSWMVADTVAKFDPSRNDTTLQVDSIDPDHPPGMYPPVLRIHRQHEAGAPTGPDTHAFVGDSCWEAHTCAWATYGCGVAGCTQAVATSGIYELTAGGAVGDGFQGTLTGLVLEQATDDPATGLVTLVPGGDVWCVPDTAFDVTLE
jgi:hypothetical protein